MLLAPLMLEYMLSCSAVVFSNKGDAEELEFVIFIQRPNSGLELPPEPAPYLLVTEELPSTFVVISDI
jgi:hypothetical protein